MAIQLNAEIRSVAGKGAARAVRNNKKIPAVIYGEKTAPLAIELDDYGFGMLLRTPGLRTKLFEIKTPAGQENVMLADIQYHPVTDNAVHVDFKRIDVKKPVHVVVPVECVNIETSKGLKVGGVLNFAVRQVALVGLIESIPEKIVIDLSELGIGDSVHGSDLKLPNGVELGLRMADLAFAAIGGKMAEEASDVKKAEAPAAAPTAAAAPAKGKPAKK
ncbi:MAG: 50S ribosomal protein L25/general stress protein Ctc [Rickettsiales bacterium]|jgi:large subunit ribosomal protein L25|nr:50S ribosomal protein L25/general stress protein Ctc [Rickettsiales bacterium]